MENKITRHIAERLLKSYFPNKKAMSQMLDIPYRSLLRFFNGQSYPREAQRIMNAIAYYCMKHRIPLEELFADFVPIS